MVWLKASVKTLESSTVLQAEPLPAAFLFTYDLLWFFISSKPKENGLTQLVVAGPLGKLDLGDQYGFDPVATFHSGRVIPCPLCRVFSPADLQTEKTVP